MGSKCSCIMNKDRTIPQLIGIELHKQENTKLHHTEKFAPINDQLVIRRGQDFKVTLTFNQIFNREKYLLATAFKTGETPRINNGTLIQLTRISQVKNCKSTEWAVWTEDEFNQTDITLNIAVASNALVAEWFMEIQIFDVEKIGAPVVTFPVRGIFILFNPWSQHDDVYMKTESKLDEYILNDVGKVWRGVNTSFRGMIWNYGQFEKAILEASMKMLDVSPRLRRVDRGNVIILSRELTAMVNSNDGDNGIVVGNWSGNYADGKAPTDWQGSVEMLQEWMTTGKPVNYGQCWNFAAVLTTVMRTLGIPCRTITNFESAHDTDATITHDVHVDLEGNKLADETHDSIWNFHVWNEAWMARPDLPKGYGGWQVLDATPQERSANSGIYQTGPASVTAVRKGEVGLKYDTAFVFAEVNADKVIWLSRGQDEPLEVLNIEPNSIGQFISTKRPGQLQFGNNDRRDVTHRYKAREMSLEERMTLMRAVDTAKSPARNIYQNSGRRDITGSIAVEKTPWIGDDFKLKVKIENTSAEERNIDSVVKLESMLYTGALYKLIKHQRIQLWLAPSEVKEFEVTVRAREYIDKLIDQASIVASSLVIVKETRQVFPTDYIFRFKLPDIHLEPPDVVSVNQVNQVKVLFSNPLNVALTHGRIFLEGLGLHSYAYERVDQVAPYAQLEIIVNITPIKTGEVTLLASFSSLELRDVIGSVAVNVQ